MATTMASSPDARSQNKIRRYRYQHQQPVYYGHSVYYPPDSPISLFNQLMYETSSSNNEDEEEEDESNTSSSDQEDEIFDDSSIDDSDTPPHKRPKIDLLEIEDDTSLSGSSVICDAEEEDSIIKEDLLPSRQCSNCESSIWVLHCSQCHHGYCYECFQTRDKLRMLYSLNCTVCKHCENTTT